jgi:hypothetical protein
LDFDLWVAFKITRKGKCIYTKIPNVVAKNRCLFLKKLKRSTENSHTNPKQGKKNRRSEANTAIS